MYNVIKSQCSAVLQFLFNKQFANLVNFHSSVVDTDNPSVFLSFLWKNRFTEVLTSPSQKFCPLCCIVKKKKKKIKQALYITFLPTKTTLGGLLDKFPGVKQSYRIKI